MRIHRFVLAAVGLLVLLIVTLVVYTTIFKENAKSFSVVQGRAVVKQQVEARGLHFEATGRMTSELHKTSINDCGPLFEEEVNRSVTGRVCHFETYTETLKDVVRTLLTHKHPEAETYDWKTLGSGGLADIHIAVRTSYNFHLPRLSLLMATWMQKVPPSQVHIYTDTKEDQWVCLAKAYGFDIHVTECNRTHGKSALCCKNGAGYEQYFLAQKKGRNYRWYCHFDDDEYVNVEGLLKVLTKYNPERERIYLGHMPPRGSRGLKINVQTRHLDEGFPDRKTSQTHYSYATGPVHCLSSSLMEELEQYISGPVVYSKTCEKFGFADDYTLGALVGTILGYNMTEEPLMMSQVDREAAKKAPLERLQQMATISAFVCGDKIRIPAPRFMKREDPSRFLSYHCLLYPETSWCNKTIA